MPKSRGHSEWSHDFGGGATLFFGEGDRLAKPSCSLSGKSVIRGENAELSTETYKILSFLFLLPELLLGNSAHIPPSYTVLFK